LRRLAPPRQRRGERRHRRSRRGCANAGSLGAPGANDSRRRAWKHRGGRCRQLGPALPLPPPPPPPPDLPPPFRRPRTPVAAWLAQAVPRQPQGWSAAGGGGREQSDRGPPRRRPGTRWCRSPTAVTALVNCPAAARPRDLRWLRRCQRRPASRPRPPNQLLRNPSWRCGQRRQSPVLPVPASPPSLRWPAAPLWSAPPLCLERPAASRTTVAPGRRRRRQRRFHRVPQASLPPTLCPPALGPPFRRRRCRRRARRPSVTPDGAGGGGIRTSPLPSPPPPPRSTRLRPSAATNAPRHCRRRRRHPFARRLHGGADGR